MTNRCSRESLFYAAIITAFATEYICNQHVAHIVRISITIRVPVSIKWDTQEAAVYVYNATGLCDLAHIIALFWQEAVVITW